MGGVDPAGLSARLDPADVKLASGNRQDIMTALRSDAGFMSDGAPSWYDVTLAGFNYVDDRCAEYFDTLFKLNRKKESLKSSLSAFDQTSSAIMSITGTTEVTMQVIAQAFGLASNMTDIIAGTYLFELPPATTQKFVDETLHAYRNGAEENRNLINSPTFAYGYIRGYLNLCLPATIEGKLVDHIGGARAVADGGGAGADLAVRVVSDNSGLVLSELIADAKKPIGDVVLPPPDAPGLNEYEKNVDSAVWRVVQQAICAKVDGDPGAATHAAIAEFFTGYGETDPEITTRGIGPSQMDVLMRAVNDAGGKSCHERGVADAKAAGKRV